MCPRSTFGFGGSKNKYCLSFNVIIWLFTNLQDKTFNLLENFFGSWFFSAFTQRLEQKKKNYKVGAKATKKILPRLLIIKSVIDDNITFF